MIRRTSIEAYHRIEAEGLLSPRRWAIYKVLFEHGPLTCNEIFKKVQGYSLTNQPNIHARLNEMFKMGCVKECGEKICPVTGMTVILWDVTEIVPLQLMEVREPTRRELIEALCQLTERALIGLEKSGAKHEQWWRWREDATGLLKTCIKYRAKRKVSELA